MAPKSTGALGHTSVFVAVSVKVDVAEISTIYWPQRRPQQTDCSSEKMHLLNGVAVEVPDEVSEETGERNGDEDHHR